MTESLNSYMFKHNRIGIGDATKHTFILFRTSENIKIRKYPEHIGISSSILLDLIRQGYRLIIVSIDDIPTYKIDPRKWLDNAKKDRLREDQEYHAFLPIEKFEKVNTTSFGLEATSD